MMSAAIVKERIRAGRRIANAWLSTDSAFSAEVLAHAGFDTVTVDAQHGMLGRDAIWRILQAVSSSDAIPMARPSSMDVREIGWLLDAGALGIIAPSVDTPELAADLVAACFYPPSGRRSFGPSRALVCHGYDYASKHEETIMPWAMIESASAVEKMESIVSTPGLFGVFLGPNDLARDLGANAGPRIEGSVEEAAHALLEAARDHGLATGLFCTGPEEARRWASAGFDLVTPGKDITQLQRGAAEAIEAVRSAR